MCSDVPEERCTEIDVGSYKTVQERNGSLLSGVDVTVMETEVEAGGRLVQKAGDSKERATHSLLVMLHRASSLHSLPAIEPFRDPHPFLHHDRWTIFAELLAVLISALLLGCGAPKIPISRSCLVIGP